MFDNLEEHKNRWKLKADEFRTRCRSRTEGQENSFTGYHRIVYNRIRMHRLC